jgi:hypothetical protein
MGVVPPNTCLRTNAISNLIPTNHIISYHIKWKPCRQAQLGGVDRTDSRQGWCKLDPCVTSLSPLAVVFAVVVHCALKQTNAWSSSHPSPICDVFAGLRWVSGGCGLGNRAAGYLRVRWPVTHLMAPGVGACTCVLYRPLPPPFVATMLSVPTLAPVTFKGTVRSFWHCDHSAITAALESELALLKCMSSCPFGGGNR